MTKENEDGVNMPRMKSMAIRGTDFRDDYEYELYGEEVVAVLRPLPDDEFLPLAAALAAHFDVDDEDLEPSEMTDEANERIEEASDEEGDGVDVSKMDSEFVDVMQSAAKLGLVGERGADGNVYEYSAEERDEVVESMMGGYSVEIGGEVLDLCGDVRDAEKFRGTRGSIEHTRSE